jgi:hypothetical protein
LGIQVVAPLKKRPFLETLFDLELYYPENYSEAAALAPDVPIGRLFPSESFGHVVSSLRGIIRECTIYP